MVPVVQIQVARVAKLLRERKIVKNLSDAAKALLGRVGYDPVYGARRLKRAIQRHLQNPLADMLWRSEVPDGSTGNVEESDGALTLAVGCFRRQRVCAGGLRHYSPLGRVVPSSTILRAR